MKALKKWIIASIILIASGLVIFLIALIMNTFNFGNFSASKFQKNIYEINDNFNNISINVDTSFVTLVKSKDGKCKVECHEEENKKHIVEVVNGILTINIDDKRSWINHIGINFNSTPKVIIYLPNDTYTTLNIVGTTGPIHIPIGLNFETALIKSTTAVIYCEATVTNNIICETTTGRIKLYSTEAKTINLKTITGHIEVNNTSCDNITVEGTTGNIKLNRVIVSEKMKLNATAGAVILDFIDASEISIKTTTGRVSGKLYSDKIFVINTSTGNVNVPNSTTGGKCEITTTTGNISIQIPYEK